LELIKSVRKKIDIEGKNGEFRLNNERKEEFMDLLLVHKNQNESFKLAFDRESHGTKKFIFLLYSLLKVPKNSIVLLDEVETSLNIEIVDYIIKYLVKNKNCSQFLFSTHQPDVLNNLRSDQIKIIERKELSSKIINLHDLIKNNKKINKDYGEYYKQGVLGGIPVIYNDD
jgi:uncharacterized protein